GYPRDGALPRTLRVRSVVTVAYSINEARCLMGNVRRFGSALVAVLAGVSLGVGAAPAASAAAIVTEGCLESVPDPGTSTPVSICNTRYMTPNTISAYQVT